MKKNRILSVTVTVLAVTVLLGVFADIFVGGDFSHIAVAVRELFGNNEDLGEIVPGDGGRIYQSLMGLAEYENIAVDKGISLDRVEEILRNVKENDHYHCVYKITRFDGTANAAQTVEIRKSGDRYRINTSSADGESYVISSGGKLFTKSYTGESYTVESGSFSVSQQAGIPDVSSLADTLNKDGVTSTCSIANDISVGYSILCVDYHDPSNGRRETVYIHIEAGVVISAQSYYTDNLYYQCSTESISYGKAMADAYFEF